MNVRQANSRDVEAIDELARQSAGAAAWTREQYAQIIDNSAYAVLVVEDTAERLFGFVIGQFIVDELEIQNIAVEPTSRERGLGSRLLFQLESVAGMHKASNLILEVRESNTAARKFYEKHGFREVGRRQKYYRNPEEAAVLYRKNLRTAAPENA
jgi:ribosomal-protein-alanine acetyltransferase